MLSAFIEGALFHSKSWFRTTYEDVQQIWHILSTVTLEQTFPIAQFNVNVSTIVPSFGNCRRMTNTHVSNQHFLILSAMQFFNVVVNGYPAE